MAAEPTATDSPTPAEDPAPANRAARRAAKKGKKSKGAPANGAAPPGVEVGHIRSAAQGRRVNPIRRTGS